MVVMAPSYGCHGTELWLSWDRVMAVLSQSYGYFGIDMMNVAGKDRGMNMR